MTSPYVADPSEAQRRVWCDKQTDLRQQHILQDRVNFDPNTLEGLKYIAGVDLSFPLGDDENAVACLVVMSMPDLKVKKIIMRPF